MYKTMKFSKLLKSIRKTLIHPDSEILVPHYDAIVELQDVVNQIIQNIQPVACYPRAEDLSLIRYHNRFESIMDNVVDRAIKDKSMWRMYLPPGAPESERLHKWEIDQLKDLGYKVRITIDDDYEAIVSW
jgi:hypothetical protein